MTQTKFTSRILLAFLLMLMFTGCSVLRADPAEDAGFIEHPELLKNYGGLSGKWISEKYRNEKPRYNKILVRPVNTDYLKKTGDWKHIQVTSAEEIRKDADELAMYVEVKFKEAFGAGKAPHLALVETPGPDTLVLEMALVELIPTDVVRTAAGTVAGFLVPGGGLASAGAGGSIAFEARMLDGETGEVLATAKDRRTDKIAPVNLAGLTPYRHARHNIDDWVEGIVEAFTTPVDQPIRVSSPFTLKPW